MHQCTCPFYSSHAGFFGKTSHHPGLSACQLSAYSPDLALCDFRFFFPKVKIAVESEICECDSHTVHKLSQRHLTADRLAPWASDCSQVNNKVSSDWLPSYIKATRTVHEIFIMAGYFPDSPRIESPWRPGCYFQFIWPNHRCPIVVTTSSRAWR